MKDRKEAEDSSVAIQLINAAYDSLSLSLSLGFCFYHLRMCWLQLLHLNLTTRKLRPLARLLFLRGVLFHLSTDQRERKLRGLPLSRLNHSATRRRQQEALVLVGGRN